MHVELQLNKINNLEFLHMSTIIFYFLKAQILMQANNKLDYKQIFSGEHSLPWPQEPIKPPT